MGTNSSTSHLLPSLLDSFKYASSFEQNLAAWDVSSVTTLWDTFFLATSFTGAGLSGWDVSNNIDLQGTFYAATSFVEDISAWDVGRVTTMRFMLNSATAFNLDLCLWATRITIPPANSWASEDMFLGSGCTDQGDADFSSSPIGPLCRSCAPTPPPTPPPTMAPTLDHFTTRAELSNQISIGDWVGSIYGPIATWDVSRIDQFAGKSCWVLPLKSTNPGLTLLELHHRFVRWHVHVRRRLERVGHVGSHKHQLDVRFLHRLHRDRHCCLGRLERV